MRTVLHLIGSLEMGGTENMLLTYIKSSTNKNLRHIVCTLYSRGSLMGEFRRAEISVVTLGLPNKLLIPFAPIKFALMIRRIKPDIIHSYLLQENIVARLVCKLMNKKLICGKRDTDSYKAFWKVWLDRITLPFATLNISNSEAGVRELRSYGIPENKVIFIPNGKDISIFDLDLSKKDARKKISMSEEVNLLGCIARLYKFKGHEYLLKAMPAILKENKDTKLLLVGDGEMRGTLIRLAFSLGIEKDVIFLGERKDIPQVLKALDVFIFPSLREGMPGALMEAMASGLPVVATKIDGNLELIEDGKEGILIPPRDSEAIAQAVNRLLKDRKRLKAMGGAAKEKIRKEFSTGAMVAKLDAAYLAF